MTVTESPPVAPGPVCVDVTAPVVVLLTPGAVPATLTENVHEPLAAAVPPVSEIVEPSGAAVTVPPQAFVAPFGFATASPAGSVSVIPTPVSPVDAFGLWIVNVA